MLKTSKTQVFTFTETFGPEDVYTFSIKADDEATAQRILIVRLRAIARQLGGADHE